MRIETVTLTQVMALNLRHRIAEAAPGYQRWDYDRYGKRYARGNYPEESARAGVRLGEALHEWAAADPDGFAVWVADLCAGQAGDPCAYCRECRPRR